MAATHLVYTHHRVVTTYLESTRLFQLALAATPKLQVEVLAGVAVAGFVAQLVDGSLGMGYGITSTTVLVAAGLSPTTASASVHLAQLGTTAVSGIAHHKCGNVDVPSMTKLAVPGTIGAFLGSTLLSTLSSTTQKNVGAFLLCGMGVRVLARFVFGKVTSQAKGSTSPPLTFLGPLGLIGGFVDATGGGGWGPVATSGLLADGRLSPSRAIGTVSASEFFVTVAAVLGFLMTLGTQSSGASKESTVRGDLVLTLLLGGVAAAPMAPLLVNYLDARLLGVFVGGFVCFTNVRTLLRAAAFGAGPTYACYAALAAVVGLAAQRVAAGGARKEEKK